MSPTLRVVPVSAPFSDRISAASAKHGVWRLVGSDDDLRYAGSDKARVMFGDPEEGGNWALDIAVREFGRAHPDVGSFFTCGDDKILSRLRVREQVTQVEIAFERFVSLLGYEINPSDLARPAAPPTPCADSSAGPSNEPLTMQVFEDWLASNDGTLDEETIPTYRGYARTLWLPFFKSFAGLLRGGAGADYNNGRLKEVLRGTLTKELSALRGFLRWAKERGLIDKVPDMPAPPPKATGKRSNPNRKSAAVPIEPKEIEAFLAALPELSSRARRGSKRHPVRDVFVFAWETGLRPGTYERISVPEHWTRGSTKLVIADEIDKARFGRELPLTPRAVAVLERWAPADGLIFGVHDYRSYFYAAAKAAGLDEARAKHLSPYDFRHERAQYLLTVSGDMPAVAFNHGHKLLSTTNGYLRPSKRAHEKMLASVLASESSASTGAGGIGAPATIAPEGVLDDLGSADYSAGPPSRRWRNWQTHWIQVPASPTTDEVEIQLARALAFAAENGRWRLARELLGELAARRTARGAL